MPGVDDLNWGQQAAGTQVNPAVQEGWGIRNWDWQFSAGVQHEILPRVSVDVSYSRRWWGNFFVTHNRALTAADYDEVTLTAPSDPRLPGGGGYPVSFLVRNNLSVLGVSDPYYTTSKDFGDETHYWQGVDVTFNTRLANGVMFQGGTSTGRGANDTCEVLIGRYGRPMAPGVERLSSTGSRRAARRSHGRRRCAGSRRTRYRRSTSSSARSCGRSRTCSRAATWAPTGRRGSANYLMNATQFLAFTGRPLRPGVTTETVNLLLPGQLSGERVNNVDLRVAKVVRVEGNAREHRSGLL